MASTVHHQRILDAADFFGSQQQLANLLGITQGAISQMAHRVAPVPPKYALKIHELTGGRIAKWELRPDLWAPPRKRRAA